MREAAQSAVRELEGDDSAGDHVGCPNMWADKQRSRDAFDYDADVEVEKWFEEHGPLARCPDAALSRRSMTSA